MSMTLKRTHLTIVEVVKRWRVSPNYVRREIWRGAIKSTRFGRCIRIPIVEADRYAERNTHKAG